MSDSGPYVRIFFPQGSAVLHPLSFRIEESPGSLLVTFAGDVDENADFSALRPRLRGPVLFDLADVRRINSCGVREWVNFHRELSELADASSLSLEYLSCSPAVVAQLNTISNFRGPARVRSFLVPYVCEGCNGEEIRQVEVASHPPSTALPDFPCVRCGARLVLDDLPDRYLSFLREL